MNPERVREYHIHIYYDAAQGPDAARALCGAIAARFEVEIGVWREEAGGPHPRPMFQVNFALERFAEIVPWLMLNRGGLSVLVHPETGDEVSDRGDHALWLGANALHARLKRRGSYHVGPMARYSLNSDKLTPAAKKAAEDAGLEPVCTNPFRSIVVRAVEIAFACEEALRLINAYERPTEPFVPVEPNGRVGYGASEAPRGILYHRYEVDEEGLIADAHIVPPTSQNQLSIEDDLKAYVPGHAHLSDEQLQWQLEQAIRNYDPCISCATHFLDLTVERDAPGS